MDSKTYIKDLIHFPLHSAIFGQRQKESFTISQGHSSLGVSCHFITNKLATLPLNKQTHSKPTSLWLRLPAGGLLTWHSSLLMESSSSKTSLILLWGSQYKNVFPGKVFTIDLAPTLPSLPAVIPIWIAFWELACHPLETADSWPCRLFLGMISFITTSALEDFILLCNSWGCGVSFRVLS